MYICHVTVSRVLWHNSKGMGGSGLFRKFWRKVFLGDSRIDQALVGTW
jgi:hypothetical protein